MHPYIASHIASFVAVSVLLCVNLEGCCHWRGTDKPEATAVEPDDSAIEPDDSAISSTELQEHMKT